MLARPFSISTNSLRYAISPSSRAYPCMFKITVIRGDGVGVEVAVGERKVLGAVAKRERSLKLRFTTIDWKTAESLGSAGVGSSTLG